MMLQGLWRGLLVMLPLLMALAVQADELGRGFVGVPQILNQPDVASGAVPMGVLEAPPASSSTTAAEPVTLPAPTPQPPNEFQRFV